MLKLYKQRYYMNFLNRKYPTTRLRRMRKTDALRNMVRETHLLPAHLIAPIFVVEGTRIRQSIDSMPDVYRLSIDNTIDYIKQLQEVGVNTVDLFAVVNDDKKSADGAYAYDKDTLCVRAILQIKDACPDVVVMTDVALDPYTTHGQDGLIDKTGYVINDETIDALVKQALVHAKAGADIISPSDMMDGRIGRIRQAFEENDLHNTAIMAYSAKYASAYYGPFRDAVGSKSALKGHKKQYQMDPANFDEALHEIALDIQEGADMVMVKPAGAYMDIIYATKKSFGIPTIAYQVSGEYAMHMAAIQNGWLDESVLLESLIGLRRSGADAILTYAALKVAKMLV